eukprot:scaffold35092_cov48-Phaeocystis_antarctica.AAC.1
MPSGSIQSGSLRYKFFSDANKLCYTQILSLLGYSATIISCALFGRLFRKRSLKLVVVAGGVLGCAASLLDLPLPLLCAHALPSPSFSLPPPSSAPPPPLPLPCDVNEAFGVSAASSVVGGLLTELAFLPRLVLATEVAATLGDRSSKLGSAEADRYGRMGAAQWYAIMLMVLDLGGAISLQLTVPIVTALGISYGAPRDFSGFSALPELIVIQAACNGFVLLVLALLWFAPRRARAAQ